MYLDSEKAKEFLKALKKLGYAQPIAIKWLSRKKGLSFRTESMFLIRIKSGKFESSWAECLIEMVGKSDAGSAQKLRGEFLNV